MTANGEALARQLQEALLTPLAAVAARLDSVMALSREPQVQRRVGEAAAELARLAGVLRAQLRDLQHPADDGALAALHELVLDAGQRLGCVPKCDLDPALAELDAPLVQDVREVLTEAIANVVRHAYAGSIEVSAAVGADLVVTVRDDGVGPNEEPTSGTGLARLAALAEGRGGTSEITGNSDGFGSRFTWQVPLRG